MRHRQLFAIALLFMIVPAIAAFGLVRDPEPARGVVASASSPAVIMSQPADPLYSLPQPTPSPPPPTTTTTHYHPPTTQPPPVARAAAPAPAGRCGGWLETFAGLWPADQVSTACRIAQCESGFNPDAQNRSSSAAGLFQILKMHAWRFEAHGWSWNDRYDGYKNSVVAYDLWRESGWRPWVCRG